MHFALIFIWNLAVACALPVRESDKTLIAQLSPIVGSDLIPLTRQDEVRRSRKKRFITRVGICANNHIMVEPLGCMSCKEYEELTEEECPS